MRNLFIVTIILFALGACYNDNEESLFPGINSQVCDTSNVTFSGNVKSIISNNCITCHSNNNSPTLGGGIRLQDFQDVSANSDRVIGAIEHRSGFIPMPKTGGKLDQCYIDQFNKWVEGGKLNN